MTSLAAVPADRIARQADAARPGRFFLLVISAVFWALGKLTAIAVRWAWRGCSYAVAAWRTGWTEAYGPSKRAQINLLERQVADLAAALERVSGSA